MGPVPSPSSSSPSVAALTIECRPSRSHEGELPARPASDRSRHTQGPALGGHDGTPERIHDGGISVAVYHQLPASAGHGDVEQAAPFGLLERPEPMERQKKDGVRIEPLRPVDRKSVV